jgi:hypothetical protein
VLPGDFAVQIGPGYVNLINTAISNNKNNINGAIGYLWDYYNQLKEEEKKQWQKSSFSSSNLST